MSQDLHAFFARVTEDPALQERLYITKEISDVAVIAKELGFKINGADILRAQANRVLSLPVEEQEILAGGGKSKYGAQWGRAGKGYLERAGFWIVQFIQWGYSADSEQKMGTFLAKIKKDRALQARLLSAKTHNDVAALAQRDGFEISGVEILRHQAKQILKLDDQKTKLVASGGDIPEN